MEKRNNGVVLVDEKGREISLYELFNINPDAIDALTYSWGYVSR